MKEATDLAEYIFAFIFTLEMLLKMFALGMCGNGSKSRRPG